MKRATSAQTNIHNLGVVSYIQLTTQQYIISIPTGITNIGVSENGENINTQYYTVSGVQTNGKTKGVYIQKSTDNTGKVIIKKVIKRQNFRYSIHEVSFDQL